MAPFHAPFDNPTLALERDLELLEWLDSLGYDVAWIGEHHSCGWEIIASPEIFIAAAAQRTKHIRLGTGVIPLPYHNPLIVANRMVLLDHLTRGRTALGVGPGALNSDGHMLGLDHQTVRRRMGESLDAIMRLLTEKEPFSLKTDWFELVDAHLHLRPFTQPHFEIAVASAQSPVGMQLAGKHGATPLSLTFARSPGGFYHNTLEDLWNIAVETGAEHGHEMKREDWGLVMHAFLADTREEAMEIARHSAGLLQREYFEKTIGMAPIDAPLDKIIDHMVGEGAWCIGTPDDLVEAIHRLDDMSGGFGTLILLATEVGTREQVMHSYELIARYVMPRFQGSLDSLNMSQDFFRGVREELADQRERALSLAGTDYEKARASWKK
jgi:limonene 1,2-monooxygenase